MNKDDKRILIMILISWILSIIAGCFLGYIISTINSSILWSCVLGFIIHIGCLIVCLGALSFAEMMIETNEHIMREKDNK